MGSRHSLAVLLVALAPTALTASTVREPSAQAAEQRTAISNSLGAIFRVDVRGGPVRELTPHDRFDGWPTTSTGGGRLAFASISRARAGDAGLRSVVSVMSTDGSHFRTYGMGLYQPETFAWSSDDRLLAFSSSWRGTTSMVNLSTGRVRTLAAHRATAAQWSRDDRLALELPGTETSITAVFDRGGKRLWQIPGLLEGWSPDGKRIAIYQAGQKQLLIADPNGGRLGVFRGVAGLSWVGWAPDGRHLAFTDGSLRVARLRDGSITRIAGSTDGSPAWSPDGRTIAFATGGPEAPTFVTAVGAPQKRRLVFNGGRPLGWITTTTLLALRWSASNTGKTAWEVVPVAGGRATVLAGFPQSAQVSAQLTPDRQAVILFNAVR